MTSARDTFTPLPRRATSARVASAGAIGRAANSITPAQVPPSRSRSTYCRTEPRPGGAEARRARSLARRQDHRVDDVDDPVARHDVGLDHLGLAVEAQALAVQ